ncbi:MAG: nicotinate phosphoribosyltransferase, partial [Coriobacteriia bacterium]|nr:nicotinate phosphoribosyltransferase [Coriobacteriia bacterium]
VDLTDATRRKAFDAQDSHEEMLVPVFRNGECVYELPGLDDVRERVRANLAELDSRITRFLYPQTYAVGVEKGLYELRQRLIYEARGVEGDV